jgi:hypothetical protein
LGIGVVYSLSFSKSAILSALGKGAESIRKAGAIAAKTGLDKPIENPMQRSGAAFQKLAHPPWAEWDAAG